MERSWVDLFSGTEFLRILYPDDIPSLRRIIVHEVSLKRDRMALLIRFDLAHPPVALPSKWITQRVNTVQVSLAWSILQSVQLNGFTPETEADLLITENPPRTCIDLIGAGWSLKAQAQFGRIAHTSGYHDTLRA